MNFDETNSNLYWVAQDPGDKSFYAMDWTHTQAPPQINPETVLYLLLAPLLQDKGYRLRKREIQSGTDIREVSRSEGVVTVVQKFQSVWCLESLANNTILDILFHGDAELLIFLVELLFPERVRDYIQVALDVTDNESFKTYLRGYLDEKQSE